MQRRVKWLLGMAGFLIAVPTLSWLSAWLYMASIGCGGNEAAADRAREIDDRTFLQLHREAESMVAAARGSAALDFVVPVETLPPAARSVGARYANVFGNDVLLNLSGCRDDKVFLSVTVGDAGHPAVIALSPGETLPMEILWRKPASDRTSH